MTGYHKSPQWARFARKAKPIIAATLPAPCVQPRCQLGGTVYPEQAWDIGHLPGVALGEETIELVGPSHRRCNRSDGGKVGRAKQLEQTRTERRRPKW